MGLTGNQSDFLAGLSPVDPGSPGGVLISPEGGEAVPSQGIDYVWKGAAGGAWVQGPVPTSPPTAHDLGGTQHNADTLANLNAKVSDATLIDTTDSRLSDSRTPTAHDLAGALHNSATLAALNAKISDATLDDSASARTPLAHKLSHQHGGADEVATATPAANAIPKADSVGKFDLGWLPDTIQQGALELPGRHLLGTIMNYLNAGGGTASEIQYSRIWLTAGVTITDMEVFIDTLGSLTRLIRLGLYDQATPTSHTDIPRNKVAETAEVDTNVTSSYKIVPLTSSYPVPTTGYYWIAFVCNAALTKFAVSDASPAGFLPVRRASTTGTTLPTTAVSLSNPAGSVAFAAAKE